MPVRVVSVINYKGGVGKTTLTANIGAALAFTGRRVLLIDLDPQTSLTFSFYRPEEWETQLAETRTIKRWYETSDDRRPVKLADLVSTPPRVNQRLTDQGGQLDLIASHLDLINIDLELGSEMTGGTMAKAQASFLRTRRKLAEGLEAGGLAEYDVVLIDCAPNFNVTTQTAIMASSHVLIPAKPDYLSTLGIAYLVRKTGEMVAEYNNCVESRYGQRIGAHVIPEPDYRIVFTMIQQYAGEPIQALRDYMDRTQNNTRVPTFSHTLRTNNTLFAGAGADGVPAVLSETGNPDVIVELDQIAAEFELWIRK